MEPAMSNTELQTYPPILPRDALDYSADLQRALAHVRHARRLASEMLVPDDDLHELESKLLSHAERARRFATATTAAAFWSGGDPSVPVSRETILRAKGEG